MADLGEARGKIILDADLAGIDKANAAMGDFGKHTEAVGQSAKNTTPLVRGVGTTATIAAVAVAAGFAVAAKTAADFEFRMSAVQAVSAASEDQMESLRQKALDLGRDTVFSASDAAIALEELVKAGLSVDDVLNGAADATVALAAAGGVELPEAATIAANAMNQFGLSAEDMVNVADKIAGAANASAIDMADFGLSLGQVGAVANLAGINFDDTATAIALMGNAGIKGSDAGTSLKAMFLRLNPQTKEATKLMEDLGIITEDGKNQFYDQNGAMKDLASVSQILQDSLAGMTAEQKQATLTTLFGTDAIRSAAIVSEAGAEGFDAMAESMGKISAADVAATRMDNLTGKMEQLKGSVETSAIQLGTVLLPTIEGIVENLTKLVNWFTSLDGSVQKAIIAAGLFAVGLLGALAVVSKLALGLSTLRTNLLLASGAQSIFGKTGLIAATATKALAAAQRIYNLAVTANPIIKIIVIILAVVAALVSLAGGWDEVKKAFQPVLETLISAGKKLLPSVMKIVDALMLIVDAVISAVMPILLELAEKLFPVLMEVLDALVPIISMVADVLLKILGPVLGIVATLLTALGPVIGTLLDALGPLIDLLIKILVPIIEAVVWVLEKLGEGLQWVIDWVTNFFTKTEDGTSKAGSAWESFMARVQPIIDWFQTYVAPIIQGVVDVIVAAFTWLWEAVKTYWTNIWDKIQAFLEWYNTYVAPLVQAVVDLLVAIFTFLWNTAQEIWTNIWNGIKAFIDWFTENVAPLIRGVVDVVVAIFTYLWNTASKIWTSIRDAIAAVVNWVVDHITAVWSKIWSIVGPFFEKVRDAISEPLQEALDFILGIKDKIVDFFSRAKDWLLDAGKNIIQGLIDGINNKIKALTDILGNITDLIPDSKGPPRKDKILLEPAGEMIMKGLISGIVSQVGNLKGVLGGLTATIPPSIMGGVMAGASDARSWEFNYNAAPGAGQIDGKEDLIQSLRRARAVVPGWGQAS